MKAQYTIAGLGFVAIIAIAVLMQHKANRVADRLDRFENLCVGAKDAMRQDAMAFEGSDDKAREAAYERFYEGHALYHSAESLLYCVDTLPEMPLGCQLNKDWACLAKIARQIQASLP